MRDTAQLPGQSRLDRTRAFLSSLPPMTTLAWTLAVVTTLAAGLHAYWGMGGTWPAARSSGLAGENEDERSAPTDRASFAVAALLVVVALMALALADAFAQPFGRLALAGSAVFTGLAFLAIGASVLVAGLPGKTARPLWAGITGPFYFIACLALGGGFVAVGIMAYAA